MFRFQVKIRDLKTTNFDVQIQESPAKSDFLKVKYIVDGSRFFFNHLELIILVVTAYYFVIALTASGVWGEEKGKHAGNDGKIKEEESLLKFFTFSVAPSAHSFPFIIQTCHEKCCRFIYNLNLMTIFSRVNAHVVISSNLTL